MSVREYNKMMAQVKVVKTLEDGWDCEPRLRRACRMIDSIDDMRYEIRNSVRSRDLESIVNNMTAALEAATYCLKEIDTNIKFETEEEDYNE